MPDGAHAKRTFEAACRIAVLAPALWKKAPQARAEPGWARKAKARMVAASDALRIGGLGKQVQDRRAYRPSS